MNYLFILLVVYALSLITITFFFSRNKTPDHYLLSKRNLSVFSFTLSLLASFIGGTALIVYSAYLFEFGAVAMLAFVGIALGLILFSFIAPKIKEISHKNKFYTFSDFFKFTYGRKVGNLVGLIIFFLLILTTLKQIIGGTFLLSSISSFSYEILLILLMSFIVLYLFFGGFISLVKTDIFQYCLIFFILLVLGISFGMEATEPLNLLSETPPTIGLLLSFLLYGVFFVWYSPVLWHRIYAAKSEKTTKKGLRFSSMLLLFFGVILGFFTLSAKTLFKNVDSSQALFYSLSSLSSDILFSLGMLLVFAAIMSSADSSIFLLATNLSKDFNKKEVNSEKIYKRTKRNVLIISLLLLIPAYFFRNIIDLALISVGLGMSLVPTIIFGFKWKLKSKAVYWSIISSLVYLVLVLFFGRLTPQTMVGAVIISTISLLIGQKIIKE